MRPLKLTLDPCVKWPPEDKSIAKIVSPGLQSAIYAAALACEPE